MAVCKFHIPCGGKFTAFQKKSGWYYKAQMIYCEYKKCRRSAIGTAS